MTMKFEVLQELAILRKTKTTEKALTLTRWNDGPAKLDLRIWRRDADGQKIAGKGMTFDDEEAATLAAVLRKYLQEQSATE